MKGCFIWKYQNKNCKFQNIQYDIKLNISYIGCPIGQKYFLWDINISITNVYDVFQTIIFHYGKRYFEWTNWNVEFWII